MSEYNAWIDFLFILSEECEFICAWQIVTFIG